MNGLGQSVGGKQRVGVGATGGGLSATSPVLDKNVFTSMLASPFKVYGLYKLGHQGEKKIYFRGMRDNIKIRTIIVRRGM